MADDLVIRVWAFVDAPPNYRQLSPHGGDEDWLALVPPNYGYVPWIQDVGPFGRCDVSEHQLPSGYTVYIGAHA